MSAAERLVTGVLDGLALRPANEGDRAYVLSTWLASYRASSRCARDVYFAGQRALIERLYPLVQVLHHSGSEVHGWIAGDRGVVHYVYVPGELRRHGFARAMVTAVAGERGEHTHRRPPGLSGFQDWTYNPYRLGMT